jgi:N-acetylmuramic acid 6-phosphate (MurNAc-6-P) etherase
MKAAGVSGGTAAETLRRAGYQLPVALLTLGKKISKAQARRLLARRPDTARLLRAALAERRRQLS